MLDNYFYYGYIAGEYSEQCCPEYLKREQFMKLRAALNDRRLTLFEGTLVDVCKQRPDVQYTVASLLDHMVCFVSCVCMLICDKVQSIANIYRDERTHLPSTCTLIHTRTCTTTHPRSHPPTRRIGCRLS